jgi:hypothetical protein
VDVKGVYLVKKIPIIVLLVLRSGVILEYMLMVVAMVVGHVVLYVFLLFFQQS